MVGKEDPLADSRGLGQVSSTRKSFWRSASWSSSRTFPQIPENGDKDDVDPNGCIGSSSGQNRRFPAPLTPRHNSKARSSLPPLQPLSIARRSLDEWPKAGSDDIGEWLQPPTPSSRGNVNSSGERLKLDLSAIQRNPDKNGCGLVRRDKIAFFDKECSKVAEHIYLGGDAVAKDKDILKQNGITHVLNCVGFVCPEYFKADFVYRTLWLQDSPSEDITSILYDVFDYFEDVREEGGRVFVHCCQGVSRSTSLVIAYLMWREGQSFDDAFQYVKAARGIADPNMGFACQLLQCQKRVHAFPLSPSSLLRMYRIAPHSPYDPLHLVPKMLNEPSLCALDSRGAFIIHVPSSIYVWIGKNCDAIMERDARGAVYQIVRYERVQGPIIMIKEGDEPPYFWDAFSDLLPLMDKSTNGVEVRESFAKICPGERKVESYNVDFEIFLKTIMGGFVPPFASSETEHETHLPARESNWSVLRRKFASGNMKEFVSATKLTLSRIYPDSMLGVDNFATKPSYSSAILSSSSSSLSLASSSSLSSASSLSSSTSSPLYLSPDSISSDSSGSSKYFSESPLMSPSMSCSLPLSSTVSTSSKLSILSPRSSPQPIFCNPEFNAVNFISQPCSQSVSSPSKRSPLSLAERRGSLSKSLKLPAMADDARVTVSLSTSAASSQEDSVRMSNNTCSLPVSLAKRRGLPKSLKLPIKTDDTKATLSTASFVSSKEDGGMSNNTCSLPVSLAKRRGLPKSLKLPIKTDDTKATLSTASFVYSKEDGVKKSHNLCSHEPKNADNAIPSKSGFENGEKNSSQESELQIPVDRVASDGEEAVFSESCDLSARNYPFGVDQESPVCNGMREKSLANCNLIRPLVCRWPSLEAVAAFDRNDFDSKAAFVFVTPDTGLGKNEHRILFFWIGRSFIYDKSQMHLEKSRELGDREEIDWNRVSCDVLTRMGLPKDTPIKVVKEGAKSVEFLEMLSSL